MEPWLVLVGLALLGTATACFATPRSIAGASIVVAALALASSLVLDLREFAAIGTGLISVLGFLAALIALARATRDSVVAARRNAETPVGSRARALALVGLAANAAVILFAYYGWAAMSRALEWRSRDRSAIADVRTVISGQEAYRMANGGFYDQLGCVATRTPCIPGFREGDVYFLDPSLAQPVKDGYRRSFHPGPPADPAALSESNASPTSLQSYAYVALPDSDDWEGIRAFCGDSSGRICWTQGSVPAVSDGRCGPPPECQTFQ